MAKFITFHDKKYDAEHIVNADYIVQLRHSTYKGIEYYSIDIAFGTTGNTMADSYELDKDTYESIKFIIS